jgi:hypothetical protein
MGQHRRVVADVDDAGARSGRLGDLVDVVADGHGGPEFEKLPDPGLDDEVAQSTGVEGGHRADRLASGLKTARQHGGRMLDRLAIDGEVRVAPRQVVLDTRRMSRADVDVDLRRLPVAGTGYSSFAHTIPP